MSSLDYCYNFSLILVTFHSQSKIEDILSENQMRALIIPPYSKNSSSSWAVISLCSLDYALNIQPSSTLCIGSSSFSSF